MSLPWLLPGAKSLSYGINMAAKRWALAHGADDVVFRSPSGGLLEGPTCSVVLDLDGVLVTPPSHLGLLPGVLRGSLIEQGKAREGELTLDDLARGFWIGNAVRGLMKAVLA